MSGLNQWISGVCAGNYATSRLNKVFRILWNNDTHGCLVFMSVIHGT